MNDDTFEIVSLTPFSSDMSPLPLDSLTDPFFSSNRSLPRKMKKSRAERRKEMSK